MGVTKREGKGADRYRFFSKGYIIVYENFRKRVSGEKMNVGGSTYEGSLINRVTL